MNKNIKIVASTIITFLILYFGISLLVNYLTIGKIIVSTNGTNDISIEKQGISSAANQAITGRGKLSASLRGGTYTVTVNNRSFSSQRVVQIKSRQTEHISVNLQTIGQVEPVTSAEVYALMATSSSLTYIDLSGHSLVNVSSENQVQALLPGVSVSGLYWASPSLGVAQDQFGTLFSVQGLVVKKMSLPIIPTINNYAISPNGLLYFSNGKTLYAGALNGSYKQILNSDTPISIINATNNGVLISVGADSNDVSINRKDSLQLISPQGKTYSGNIDVDDAAWSPNGLDLAVTTDTGTTVYDSHLKTLYQLPQSNVDSITWLNNTTVLYGIASNLWSYNIQTQTANVLTNVSDLGYVSEIYPSQDGSYIYIGIQSSSTNNIYLTRLGLNKQPVSAIMQQLQIFLPNIYQGCSLGYLDFTSPTIVVQDTDSSGLNCIASAQVYLQTYGVNIANLDFVNAN